MNNEDYIDLGLPSGTLWKRENEGVMEMAEGLVTETDPVAKLSFTSDEIGAKYDARALPSLAQFEEMIENTLCEFHSTGVVYRRSKINGKAISFVSTTERSNYYIKESEKVLSLCGCDFEIVDRTMNGGYYVRQISTGIV